MGVRSVGARAFPPSVQHIEAALRVLGGKWKLIILWHLAERPRRYGVLRRLILGVSEKMLIQQLRELERDGLVAREIHRSVPPSTTYSLTEYGRSLSPALMDLCRWGRAHLERCQGTGEEGLSRDGASGDVTTG